MNTDQYIKNIQPIPGKLWQAFSMLLTPIKPKLIQAMKKPTMHMIIKHQWGKKRLLNKH